MFCGKRCSFSVSVSECRWSPKQALQHPFITRAAFTGPFQPTPDSPVLARSPGLPYSNTSTANGYAAPTYAGPSSQGQSFAALATSPEARAQAHLAALAAVAQLSPHSSSLPAAYQAAMLQQLESAMQSASAGPMQMPALRPTSYYQHSLYQQQQQEQQQRQQQLQQQQQMMSEYMATLGSSQSGTPQRVSGHRHHSTGSDSANIGGNFVPSMPSMSAQQSLYGSYPQQQQQLYQSSARFGSIPQSPVSLPMPMNGQVPGHAPVGSLEALRYGWHAPRGRTTYGDMFPSSLTVPSQRLAGAASLAGSLGGSLAGSLGPPRLPPSLNNRSRHSFSSSPAGPSSGAVLSPSLATPPTAGTPNRVLGFGSSAYSDQQVPQQLQQVPQQLQQQLPQQLPRQQSSGQQRPQAWPQQQAHHRHQSSHDQIERLFDDWAGQGGDGGLAQHMSRQPSLDIPHPSDWDPNFR